VLFAGDAFMLPIMSVFTRIRSGAAGVDYGGDAKIDLIY
jgi:hypothetical protein